MALYKGMASAVLQSGQNDLGFSPLNTVLAGLKPVVSGGSFGTTKKSLPDTNRSDSSNRV